MDEASTINKLIILYILDEIDMPIAGSRLLELVSDKQYMDYLALNETLSGLIDADLIESVRQANRTEYSITPQGSQTLSYFQNRISSPIKKEVRDFIRKNSMSIRDETSVSTDYYKLTSGDYMVRCKITESGVPLLDLGFSVPTEMQAQSSVIKWKEKAQSVYAHIMSELL